MVAAASTTRAVVNLTVVEVAPEAMTNRKVEVVAAPRAAGRPATGALTA